ncbi:MAG TPA: glycine cleavage system protein GcvH [bacterium]|nr:glycine cleavage system protein GcvH [bacterium]HQL63461.1 glycine cleavage system protein GcvH [bacterium]
MNIPKDLLYTKTHEWVRIQNDTATVGITDHAQEQLTDIVFVETPQIGEKAIQNKEIGVVESCKIAADIYSPLSGEVIAANDRLADEPDLLNKDPYGEGWIFQIRISDESEVKSLLNAEDYQALIEKEA